ncbi:MAG TPA: FecR family protein [Kofleriaceae bacterium]
MTDDNRLGPPPIEPLSDLAWGRVERGLWARMDGTQPIVRAEPRRFWPWVVGPIVAAAAVIAIVFALRDTPAPQVLQLDEPDSSRMVTNETPSAISFDDVYISLDAASAIEMRRALGNRRSVVLERGGAWFTVGERGPRPAFSVIAGDTTVRVVGTHFRVGRSDEHVTVAVTRGTVEIGFRGIVVRLGPNQSWSSERPEIVGSVKVTAVEPIVPADPITRPGKTTRPAKPAKAKLESSTTTKIETKIDSTPVAPPLSTAERERAAYERLVAIEVTDPASALTGYIALAKGTSRWAEVALFAAGRLATDRKDSRAAALLSTYMRRFPSGANVDDARELLARLKGEP